MSTSTTLPTPPQPPVPPIETAPSATINEGPTFARLIGFIGLFLLILGVVVVAATRAVGPRLVPEGWGYLFGAFGLVLMLYHAATDGEQEIRRMYAGAAVFFLLLACIVSILPGPFENPDKHSGYFALPWGVGAGFLCLLFSIPFTRHETDEKYQRAFSTGQLVVGALLAVGSVTAGIFKPDFLVGPGIVLALLGVAFLCAYLGQIDTSDGIGYTVAFTLGVVGAAIALYAIGRAAFPTLLYDGPVVLRNPNGSLDTWKVAFRVFTGVVFLVPFAIAVATRTTIWLKCVLGAIGLIGAGVVVASLFGNMVHTPPLPFLVPNGLILIGLGFVYLALSLGICSDNQFVTLTRRELSSCFLSPIGYLVLAGMAACQWLGYWQFYESLASAAKQQVGVGFPEPIVAYYLFSLLPVLAVFLAVPALTMRLLAEEKRTGSLEVLLTSPVNEWPIVLSKFIATWLFFLLCWVPAGLFLIALRVETGQSFDYRPLLSFYVALAACGGGFISAGLFFSAITRNQIVAAVLTFALMLGLLVCHYIRDSTTGVGSTAQMFLGRLSFIDMWRESLKGQLPLRDVLVWLSATVFGLFLSVKALEIRKWN